MPAMLKHTAALAVSFTLAGIFLTSAQALAQYRSSAATAQPPRLEPASGQTAAKPRPVEARPDAHPFPWLSKLRDLGALSSIPWDSVLKSAVDVAVKVLSGNESHLLSENEAELLSNNKPELLSGNRCKLLSENQPKLLSDNKPAVLSGNQTQILSGNRVSVLSGIRLDIRISNTGNAGNHGTPPGAHSKAAAAAPDKKVDEKQERAKKRFQELDANRDGALSFEEFARGAGQ